MLAGRTVEFLLLAVIDFGLQWHLTIQMPTTLLAALAALTLIIRIAAFIFCSFVGFSLHRRINLAEDPGKEARLGLCLGFDWF